IGGRVNPFSTGGRSWAPSFCPKPILLAGTGSKAAAALVWWIWSSHGLGCRLGWELQIQNHTRFHKVARVALNPKFAQNVALRCGEFRIRHTSAGCRARVGETIAARWLTRSLTRPLLMFRSMFRHSLLPC